MTYHSKQSLRQKSEIFATSLSSCGGSRDGDFMDNFKFQLTDKL